MKRWVRVEWCCVCYVCVVKGNCLLASKWLPPSSLLHKEGEGGGGMGRGCDENLPIFSHIWKSV